MDIYRRVVVTHLSETQGFIQIKKNFDITKYAYGITATTNAWLISDYADTVSFEEGKGRNPAVSQSGTVQVAESGNSVHAGRCTGSDEGRSGAGREASGNCQITG